jgi:putative hydrolase of the HAD superfamily
MLTQGIGAIFFDAVGTLIHPEPSAAVVYARVGRRFGSRLSAGAIAPRFAAAFAAEEDADRLGGLATDEDRELRRWRHIVARVLDDASDAEACFRELYEHFRRPRAWRCDPEAGPVLEHLAGLGYRLGVASNYDHRLRPVLAGQPSLRLLGPVVISSEVGWRKPAAGFFAAVCRSVALPPEQVLYVGDDRANDYGGAEAAGLRALLLDPKGKYAAAPVRRLARLGELLPARS